MSCYRIATEALRGVRNSRSTLQPVTWWGTPLRGRKQEGEGRGQEPRGGESRLGNLSTIESQESTSKVPEYGCEMEFGSLAASSELHEATVWRACLDAIGSLPGNPLGVVVEPASDIPLGMVGAIDSAEINRVIGLGIVRDEVELMVGFCRLHAGLALRNRAFPRRPACGRPQVVDRSRPPSQSWWRFRDQGSDITESLRRTAT